MKQHHTVIVPKGAGPVERWWYVVRSQTFKQLPLEAALSYPIPVFEGGRLHLASFYYKVKHSSTLGESGTALPLAKLMATYPEGEVLSFQKKGASELFIGVFPHEKPGSLFKEPATPKERMNNRKLLFELYSDIIVFYQEKQGTENSKSAFLNIFEKVSELPLIPYYHALNPDFFQWLEGSK